MKKFNHLFFQDKLNDCGLSQARSRVRTNHSFRLFSIFAMLFIFSTYSFAQQKEANLQQVEADLIAVNEKIANLDNQINAVNARIAGIPPENVDPSVYVRLNDLQLKKDQYTREKISIEALLNENQNATQTDKFQDIPNATLPLLHNENQDQVLED